MKQYSIFFPTLVNFIFSNTGSMYYFQDSNDLKKKQYLYFWEKVKVLSDIIWPLLFWELQYTCLQANVGT